MTAKQERQLAELNRRYRHLKALRDAQQASGLIRIPFRAEAARFRYPAGYRTMSEMF